MKHGLISKVEKEASIQSLRKVCKCLTQSNKASMGRMLMGRQIAMQMVMVATMILTIINSKTISRSPTTEMLAIRIHKTRSKITIRECKVAV